MESTSTIWVRGTFRITWREKWDFYLVRAPPSMLPLHYYLQPLADIAVAVAAAAAH
jgi:hypothetical protein